MHNFELSIYLLNYLFYEQDLLHINECKFESRISATLELYKQGKYGIVEIHYFEKPRQN